MAFVPPRKSALPLARPGVLFSTIAPTIMQSSFASSRKTPQPEQPELLDIRTSPREWAFVLVLAISDEFPDSKLPRSSGLLLLRS
jgi:hypothetical protein